VLEVEDDGLKWVILSVQAHPGNRPPLASEHRKRLRKNKKGWEINLIFTPVVKCNEKSVPRLPCLKLKSICFIMGEVYKLDFLKS